MPSTDDVSHSVGRSDLLRSYSTELFKQKLHRRAVDVFIRFKVEYAVDAGHVEREQDVVYWWAI